MIVSTESFPSDFIASGLLEALTLEIGIYKPRKQKIASSRESTAQDTQKQPRTH